MSASIYSILSVLLISALVAMESSAFTVVSPTKMSTTTAPPREKTRRQTSTRRKRPVDDNDYIRKYNDNPLEYYEDEWATRDPEDPFHILLLDKTFEKERITVKYVSNSVSYVCDIPEDDAFELTSMAALNGMSCLGTWKRETCLSLGRKLQNMDIVCRVVPFCEGGSRPWQAKKGDMGEGWSADDYIDVGGGGFE